jgi:hypothetical protein
MIALVLAVLIAVHRVEAYVPLAHFLQKAGSSTISHAYAQGVASLSSQSTLRLAATPSDSSCSSEAQPQLARRSSTRRNVLQLLPVLATESYAAAVHAAESSADEFDVQFDGALGLELDNISYKGSKRLVGPCAYSLTQCKHVALYHQLSFVLAFTQCLTV